MANVPPVMPIIPPIVKIPIPKHAITEKTKTTIPRILVLLSFTSMKREVGIMMIPATNDKMIAIGTSENDMISIHLISDKIKVSKNNASRLKITSIIPEDSDSNAGILLRGSLCFVDINLS